MPAVRVGLYSAAPVLLTQGFICFSNWALLLSFPKNRRSGQGSSRGSGSAILQDCFSEPFPLQVVALRLGVLSVTSCLVSEVLTPSVFESVLFKFARTAYRFDSVGTGWLIMLGALGAGETGIFVDTIDEIEGVTRDVS